MPSKRGKRRSKEDERQASDESNQKAHVSGPRPFWSGTIAFGLVSLPVGLYPANRSKPVSLRMIDEEGTPLARRYFCEKEQRTLSNDELVRGYEIEKNEFVVVEDNELDELAPEKSQEIDLKRFVALEEIDPMYFERAYFLTPDKGATKAYRLLAKSMEESSRAGIATFVMRGKEYLVAIIAEKGILRAETLRFFEEVRTPEDVGLPTSEMPQKLQAKRFEKAIDKLTTDTLERAALEDRHSQQILARVREKLDNDEDIIGAPETAQPDDEPGGEVIDLMQVLKQSLEQGESPAGRPIKKEKTKKEASKTSGKRGGSTQASGKGKGKAASRRKSGPDLTRLSKSELYQRAQELDISGRSNMSKSQLIEAIEIVV